MLQVRVRVRVGAGPRARIRVRARPRVRARGISTCTEGALGPSLSLKFAITALLPSRPFPPRDVRGGGAAPPVPSTLPPGRSIVISSRTSACPEPSGYGESQS